MATEILKHLDALDPFFIKHPQIILWPAQIHNYDTNILEKG
jgi:hypothetical protein